MRLCNSRQFCTEFVHSGIASAAESYILKQYAHARYTVSIENLNSNIMTFLFDWYWFFIDRLNLVSGQFHSVRSYSFLTNILVFWCLCYAMLSLIFTHQALDIKPACCPKCSKILSLVLEWEHNGGNGPGAQKLRLYGSMDTIQVHNMCSCSSV